MSVEAYTQFNQGCHKLQNPESHNIFAILVLDYLPYAGTDKEECSIKYPGLKEMERFSGSFSENHLQEAHKYINKISRLCYSEQHLYNYALSQYTPIILNKTIYTMNKIGEQ